MLPNQSFTLFVCFFGGGPLTPPLSETPSGAARGAFLGYYEHAGVSPLHWQSSSFCREYSEQVLGRSSVVKPVDPPAHNWLIRRRHPHSPLQRECSPVGVRVRARSSDASSTWLSVFCLRPVSLAGGGGEVAKSLFFFPNTWQRCRKATNNKMLR